jgi:hypothetical protein
LGELRGVLVGLAERVRVLADLDTAGIAPRSGADALGDLATSLASDAASAAAADAAVDAAEADALAVPGVKPSSRTDEAEATLLGALEARLARLESAVSADGGGGGAGGRSGDVQGLVPRLMQLEEVAAALTPAGLEALSARASSTAAQLRGLRAEEAEASLRVGSGGEEERRMLQAVSELEVVEGVAALVPAVAERLTSVAELHARAAEAVQLAEAMDETNAAALAEAKVAAEAVKSLQAALLEAAQDWAKTAAAIEAKIDSLVAPDK